MAFNGTWKADRNDNFDKFMEKMGVNLVKRKLAEHDNLKITIAQKGNDFTVKESSTFRTIEFAFTLGVPFDYALADGTEIQGTWCLDGGVLNGNFTRKDNGKQLLTSRRIDGEELVQTFSYENIEAKRIFKKKA